MGIRVPVAAEMDDGRTLRAVIDQRDFAAAEAQEFPPAAGNTRTRFMAYNALRRGKQYGGSWDEFNTIDCVEVIDGEAEVPAGDDDGLDPGPRGRNADS